jgi:hypothetical protein
MTRRSINTVGVAAAVPLGLRLPSSRLQQDYQAACYNAYNIAHRLIRIPVESNCTL